MSGDMDAVMKRSSDDLEDMLDDILDDTGMLLKETDNYVLSADISDMPLHEGYFPLTYVVTNKHTAVREFEGPIFPNAHKAFVDLSDAWDGLMNDSSLIVPDKTIIH